MVVQVSIISPGDYCNILLICVPLLTSDHLTLLFKTSQLISLLTLSNSQSLYNVLKSLHDLPLCPPPSLSLHLLPTSNSMTTLKPWWPPCSSLPWNVLHAGIHMTHSFISFRTLIKCDFINGISYSSLFFSTALITMCHTMHIIWLCIYSLCPH